MAVTFDPLSPSQASSSKRKQAGKDNTTFRTLTRERTFRHPPVDQSEVPVLDELVRPHLDSFNALVENAEEFKGGDGSVAGQGKGLMQLGVEDIGEKSIFDGKPDENRPFGAKITCEW